jgi:hypothetical protein
MFGIVKTPKISALGQLLTPAGVRRRRARAAARGGGAGSPSRLTREQAIRLAYGAFKDSSGPSTDEMTRMNREEEQEIEERKYGPGPG